MRWTLEEVAQALGVAPPPGVHPLARLAGVSIDSRTLRPGELFIAVHGPRHDGHSFLAAALAAGAPAGVVARRRLGEFPEAIRGQVFAVDDTLAALQHLATAVRRKWGSGGTRRMAAVTGSTGKTTTKEILAALLAARFRVLKSEGNLNNEYGVPLTLLRLDEENEAAVVEMGMSRRGEIARLAELAEPEIGVVTNVAPVHLEFFSSLEEIALAKRELIERLRGPAPVVVLNADDPRVVRFANGFGGRVLTFGTGKNALFRAAAVEERGAEGTAFDLISPEGRARLELRLAGRHNVMNALGGLAAASVWGIGAEEARGVLAGLAPPARRGEVLCFEAGFTLIDDCYNSNPVALASMIELLASAPGCRRRVLVAGEMLELGAASAELHREAGRCAAAVGIAWILGVRGQAAELVRGAVEAGHPPSRTVFFSSPEEAANFLVGFVLPGDLVLVKGSRGVKMESIVEALQSKYALAGTQAKGALAAKQERN